MVSDPQVSDVASGRVADREGTAGPADPGERAETLALLESTVVDLFVDHCPPGVVDAAASGAGWSEPLWRQLAQAGLTLLGADDAAGDAGDVAYVAGDGPGAHRPRTPVPVLEGAALALVAGRATAPIPLAETLLVGLPLLVAAGLAPPADGGPLAVVAGPGMTLTRGYGGGWRLSGAAERVPYGRVAAAFVVVVPEVVVPEVGGPAGGTRVARVPADLARIEPGTNLAGEPRDRVVFADAAVASADVALGAVGPGAVDLGAVDLGAVDLGAVDPAAPSASMPVSLDEVALRGALARALLMAGAAERALALTLDYASQRTQFGRPIASFQAVAHHLAELAGEVSATSLAARAAAAAADEHGIVAAAGPIAAAKWQASSSARTIAAIAHQVHGAIGFTEEHALRHVTTRLWSWRDDDGDEGAWAGRIGVDVVASGPAALWPWLTTS
jgi:acyl-CoA dehydrogenase